MQTLNDSPAIAVECSSLQYQFVLPENLAWSDEFKITAFSISDSGVVHFNQTDGNAHFKELWIKYGQELLYMYSRRMLSEIYKINF